MNKVYCARCKYYDETLTDCWIINEYTNIIEKFSRTQLNFQGYCTKYKEKDNEDK